MDNRLLLAIDGNSLMFRAFYALPDMTSADGTPTGALLGFLNMLFKLLERNPSHVLVAFDVHAPTFRHKKYDAYKAGRKPTPEALLAQMPILHDILDAMGVRVCECEGFEADDILGTMSKAAERIGMPSLLVTGDRDALQLASDTATILLTKRGITETQEVTPASLFDSYGLIPDQMRDLKALMGDHSDNIPGIPGVGEKTALKLLAEHGSLTDILAHADLISGKLGDRIREHADSGRLSYWLGTICTDVPDCCTLDACRFDSACLPAARSILAKLELRSILKKLPRPDFVPASPSTESHDYAEITLNSIHAAKALTDAVSKSGRLGILLSPMIGFATNEVTSYVLTCSETLFDEGPSLSEVLRSLDPAVRSGEIRVFTFDGKQLMYALRSAGLRPWPIAADTMLLDYLAHANRPTDGFASLCGQLPDAPTPSPCCLFSLGHSLLSEVESRNMLTLYQDIELPLQRVLFDMECNGFGVDRSVLETLGASFRTRLDELSVQIYEIAGETFNILSTQQLGTILFTKLGLPPQRKTKLGFSTDAASLDALIDQHPIVSMILEYRNVSKLYSTFIDGLLKARDPADGKIHTRFQQCVTATGRISSAEPNLQNIPVRTELGREIRKAFIPSAGNVLVGADYSQIELRVLAHISGDEGMIQSFNANEDIHTRTASEVFHVAMQDVSREQRSAAKAVNFGIVYGISDYGLARNLGIPVKQAASYIERYFLRYPGISAYLKHSVEWAKSNGYAETLFHRQRAVPELQSSNFNTRQFGERVAMNMPIQGTAADIIKIAMIRVHAALSDGGFRAKLVLQVHDELIVDCPPDEADRVCELVRSCMEHVVDMRAKLVAEARIGESWYHTK